MIDIPESVALCLILESEKETRQINPAVVQEIRKFLNDAEYKGLISNNELVGVVIYESNGTMHHSFVKEGKLGVKLIKEVLSYGLDKYEEVFTIIDKDNEKAIRITEFAGFIRQPYHKENLILFKLTKDNYRFKGET